MLIDRNTLQSNGILRRLSRRPNASIAPKPVPILIRFLSRKSSDSLAINPNPKPNPQLYKKNKIMLNADISSPLIEKKGELMSALSIILFLQQEFHMPCQKLA